LACHDNYFVQVYVTRPSICNRLIYPRRWAKTSHNRDMAHTIQHVTQWWIGSQRKCKGGNSVREKMRGQLCTIILFPGKKKTLLKNKHIEICENFIANKCFSFHEISCMSKK